MTKHHDAADLTETEKWFRDRTREALSYGFVGLTVLGGWLVGNDSAVSLHHPDDADKREAARALLVGVPVLWAGWYAYLLWMRCRCCDHATVPHRAVVHGVAIVTAVGLAAILWIVAID